MQLVHLSSRIYGTPLLIARSKLDVILSVLGSRIGLAAPAIAPPVPSSRSALPSMPGIEVIPIYGTLVRRTVGLEAASGLLSYDEIAARIDAAILDPQVQGILLDVDSPGGEAGGVFDIAERIRAAGQIKPIWAIANDAAFSAAYAIACAASRLLLTRTAGVGSIGVIALHVDQSVKDAQDGLHYTAIYAGSHKNDFSPHAPLSPDAMTNLQSEVDRLHDLFIAHVASMRGLSEDIVRDTEAALYFGDQAVETGLADGVSTLDRALADLSASIRATQALRLTPGTSLIHASSSTTHPSFHRTENTMPNEHHAETNLVSHDTAMPHATASTLASATPSGEHIPSPAGDAHAIAEMCLLAGASERTAEFLAARMTEAQVRRLLIDTRANQPEIASRVTPGAATSSQPQASPVIAAVKKLIHKE
jgi:signal peptide peptidase SppA